MVLAEQRERAAVAEREAGRAEPTNSRLRSVRPGERAGVKKKPSPFGIDRDATAGLKPAVREDRAACVRKISVGA
jgi:hypothetical protein